MLDYSVFEEKILVSATSATQQDQQNTPTGLLAVNLNPKQEDQEEEESTDDGQTSEYMKYLKYHPESETYVIDLSDDIKAGLTTSIDGTEFSYKHHEILFCTKNIIIYTAVVSVTIILAAVLQRFAILLIIPIAAIICLIYFKLSDSFYHYCCNGIYADYIELTENEEKDVKTFLSYSTTFEPASFVCDMNTNVDMRFYDGLRKEYQEIIDNTEMYQQYNAFENESTTEMKKYITDLFRDGNYRANVCVSQSSNIAINAIEDLEKLFAMLEDNSVREARDPLKTPFPKYLHFREHHLTMFAGILKQLLMSEKVLIAAILYKQKQLRNNTRRGFAATHERILIKKDLAVLYGGLIHLRGRTFRNLQLCLGFSLAKEHELHQLSDALKLVEYKAKDMLLLNNCLQDIKNSS